MGRKAKLKQARRMMSEIINVNANDDNWLYIHGRPFDPKAKVIWQGKLDRCIEKAIADIPSLAVETNIREDCAEYGLVEGSGWCIMYKLLHERGIEVSSHNKLRLAL